MKVNLPEKINLNDVEALSRNLAKTRKTGACKFFLELPVRDCKNALWAAYRAEVEGRGQKCVATEENLQCVSDMAEWLLDPHGKSSIMLQGTLGTGKSALAKALCNLIKFLTSFSDNTSGSIEPTFIHAKKICEQFVRYPDDYEKLRTTRILIIDDLGEEPKEIMQYGMLYTPVLNLLEERYDRQRCTIVTTNLTSEEIESHYGQRIRDRLREEFRQVLFLGQSFRK